MTTLIDVDLAKCYRLLNHGPTVLITSAFEGKHNVMAAAWAMPLDFDPPKILVVIDKNTYSRKLIEASGEFILNVPCRAQAAQVLSVGGSSGADGDKFISNNLVAMPAQSMAAPRVAGCVGYLECKVIDEPHNQQRYDLFIGQVIAAQADADVYSQGRWHFEGHDEKRTLHYIAGGAFFSIGEQFSV
jgi:flavin reductase (DIM6/NTAB) family NADH-FMN oxidoreductase RutF